MNRITIRRFDVVRTANMVAALYGVIFLVVGLLFLIPFALLAGIAGSRADGASGVGIAGAGILGGIILTLVGVVAYTVMGWIMTAILCALYNVVAGRMGGISVEADVQGPYGGGPGSIVPGYPGYPGYPAGYGAPGSPGTPSWPAPGSPGAPTPPPPGWGRPAG